MDAGASMRFQIPMRGNEIEAIETITGGQVAFQIPMRGNEFGDRRLFFRGRGVSNPHEG